MKIGPTGASTLFDILAARPSTAASASSAYASGAGSASVASSMGGAGVSAAGGGRDFTQMTPRQMQGVAKELYDSGEIDLTQLFMLQTAGMPIGKLGPGGEFVQLSEAEKAAASSKPQNYLQIARDSMSYLEQTGRAADPTSGYDLWKGIAAALGNAKAGLDVFA